MRLSHVVSQTARRATRRYPLLRRLSITTSILTLIWFYALYQGERSTFSSHIRACHWDKWEEWPHDAKPHHLVFIADPQLVDPHTYPGRPWPLSSLTEIYTDMYMSRNFRLINSRLDPDSVVFLGDLFDGGREWEPTRARPLNAGQRQYLIDIGVVKDPGAIEDKKESDESDNTPITNFAGEEPHLSKEGADLRNFVQGERGMWSRWGTSQWDSEFKRFGQIFFEPEQLYPLGGRKLLPASDVRTDPVSMENGATDVTRKEYVLSGSKHRRVLTSLPGNHDLGFGKDVQRSVRDRFRSHFGDTNGINVIGNHTFVSVDSPSLSAYSQYWEGDETSPQQRDRSTFIWAPGDQFLNGLQNSTRKVVRNALDEYYPRQHPKAGFLHQVTEPSDLNHQPTTDDSEQKDLASDPHLPVIILTHVPLFRNPDTACGPLRERNNAIPFSAGYQYQNVLTPTVTNTIITQVSSAGIGEIVHVFSGDDHDYCDFTHLYNVESWSRKEEKKKLNMMGVREITVKSFSWAMGVRRPGFMLVSLWNPVDETGNPIGTPLPTIQSQLCLLPDQLTTFINYVLLLCGTLMILMLYSVVKSLRSKATNGEDDDAEEKENLFTPLQFQKRFNIDPDTGAKPPQTGAIHKRERSSTTTGTANGQNIHLSVQRSHNARTRSVSPSALGGDAPQSTPMASKSLLENLQRKGGPLIDQAGYYPQLRWDDPDDSDEESHLSDSQWDSQGKWKTITRPPSRARRALDEFLISVALVGVPSGLFYAVLIKNG